MLVAVLAALTSAFCFALAASLQHREALDTGASGVADFRLLWKLSHRPLWLAGAGADVLSMALHIFALSLGTLALVQPLGVTGIVFAIPLAAIVRRQRVRRTDVLAACAVVGGLIALLKSLHTRPGRAMPSVWVVGWVLLAVLVVVAVATFVAHLRPGRARALLLAIAAGTAFGLTAVLVRTLLLSIRQPGTTGVIISASVAIAILGPCGYLLLQSAYRAGHFAASVATTNVSNPVVAVVAGGLLLHESLPTGVGHLIVIGVAVLVVCAGIGLLVRSPAVLSFAPVEHADPGSATAEVPMMAGAPPAGRA